jgi:(4-(4-[2-(gamma-L-glutamylamino)ethyl]phenoxymethyl)furan-2-yl)methanamine synthase
LALRRPDAILIDTGSTTTDIVPLVSGRVAARGQTDPTRLQAGELVYTGALRTAVEAMSPEVPFRGGTVGLAAECFATSGDVHLWLGSLTSDDHTVPTPDRRPATRAFAGERLARSVCADRTMVTDDDLDVIARALAEAQIDRVAAAVARVRARHSSIELGVVTGLGEFIAAVAARRAGLRVERLAGMVGEAAARAAPAAAVALLLASVPVADR